MCDKTIDRLPLLKPTHRSLFDRSADISYIYSQQQTLDSSTDHHTKHPSNQQSNIQFNNQSTKQSNKQPTSPRSVGYSPRPSPNPHVSQTIIKSDKSGSQSRIKSGPQLGSKPVSQAVSGYTKSGTGSLNSTPRASFITIDNFKESTAGSSSHVGLNTPRGCFNTSPRTELVGMNTKESWVVGTKVVVGVPSNSGQAKTSAHSDQHITCQSPHGVSSIRQAVPKSPQSNYPHENSRLTNSSVSSHSSKNDFDLGNPSKSPSQQPHSLQTHSLMNTPVQRNTPHDQKTHSTLTPYAHKIFDVQPSIADNVETNLHRPHVSHNQTVTQNQTFCGPTSQTQSLQKHSHIKQTDYTHNQAQLSQNQNEMNQNNMHHNRINISDFTKNQNYITQNQSTLHQSTFNQSQTYTQQNQSNFNQNQKNFNQNQPNFNQNQSHFTQNTSSLTHNTPTTLNEFLMPQSQAENTTQQNHLTPAYKPRSFKALFQLDQDGEVLGKSDGSTLKSLDPDYMIPSSLLREILESEGICQVAIEETLRTNGEINAASLWVSSLNKRFIGLGSVPATPFKLNNKTEPVSPKPDDPVVKSPRNRFKAKALEIIKSKIQHTDQAREDGTNLRVAKDETLPTDTPNVEEKVHFSRRKKKTLKAVMDTSNLPKGNKNALKEQQLDEQLCEIMRMKWSTQLQAERAAFRSDIVLPRLVVVSSKIPGSELLKKVVKKDSDIIHILYDFDDLLPGELAGMISDRLDKVGTKAKSILFVCQGGPGFIYLLRRKAITPQKLYNPLNSDLLEFWGRVGLCLTKINPDDAAIHILPSTITSNRQGQQLLHLLEEMVSPCCSVPVTAPQDTQFEGIKTLGMYLDMTEYNAWKGLMANLATPE